MIETRKVDRVSSRNIIRYWTHDRSMMISQVENISESGVSIRMGKAYDQDTPVYVQMRNPLNLNQTIFLKGQIKHQEKDDTGDLYKTGIQITEMHEKDKKKLMGLIDFYKGQVQ